MNRKRQQKMDKVIPVDDPEIEAAIEKLLDRPTHSQLIFDLETNAKKRKLYANKAVSHLTSRMNQKR